MTRIGKIAASAVVAILGGLWTLQALGTPISGTNVAAPIVPFDTADTYPSHLAIYGKGGAMQVTYSSERRAIPEARRQRGMMVYSHDTRTTYQLYSSPGNFWRPFAGGSGPVDASQVTGLSTVATSGSYPDLFNKPTIPAACVDIFDGAPGAAGATGPAGADYVCWIEGGTRVLIYDAVGLAPVPPMLPFTVRLYESGLLRTPSSYSWSTPASGALISGSGTGSNFTPNVFGVYSGSKGNNWVSATVTYNGRTCTAAAPVAVTRIGATGPQGPQGDPGTITQAQILGKLAEMGGGPIDRQPLAPQTDAQPLYQARDLIGNVRLYVTAAGSLLVKSATGKTQVDITGNRIRGYRGDGVTVAFDAYSTQFSAYGRLVIQ